MPTDGVGPDPLAPASPRHQAALAIAVVFFVNGAAFASWIPHIPEVQTRLELSTSALGVVLAGTGIGGLLGTLISPRVVRAVGSRQVAVVAGVAVALVLPLLAVAPAGWVLAGLLVAAGAADALTDIAMNDLGAQSQRQTGRSLLNRLHAGWSLGVVVGAVISSALAAAGVGVGAHLAAVAVVLTAVLGLTWRFLPTFGAVIPPPTPSRRTGLAVAGVLLPLAFAAAIVEGVPAEWSTVFLADVHQQEAGAVGLGFTLFASGMLAGRFAGDLVVDRLGAARTTAAATGLMGLGLAAVAASTTPLAAVIGFGVLGLGASVLFPVIYGAAASLTAIASGAGLALMSVGARFGFLAGPPLVGVLSDAIGLRAALALLVASGLVVVTLARARLEPHLG